MTCISDVASIGGRVALLIDGENISARLAGKIVLAASKFGQLVVRRVYGDVCGAQNWSSTSGFKLVHTRAGKNSADILLSIDAVELSHTGVVERFVVASSDGDFCHISDHLRERGFDVFGIGEHKAPAGFRDACTEFVQVSHAGSFQGQIRELLSGENRNTGLAMTKLNIEMRKRYDIKISDLSEKTWRKYLEARGDIYDVDPKGLDARVRLKS